MRLFLVFLVFLLSACGEGAAPSPTFYSYAPPLTPGGVMCVDQCRQSHDYCGEACGLDYRSCINDVQAMGQQAFDRYAQESFNAHLPIDKNPSDFEHSSACVADRKNCLADCDTPYNACYKSCGGKVTDLLQPSCQFLCF